MTKLIAVHALMLSSAVKGVIDSIEPGKAFAAREDELSLIERGAARKPRGDEKDLPFATRAQAGKQTNAHTNTGGQTDTSSAASTNSGAGKEEGAVDLTKLTKAQLLAQAAKEEIEVGNGTNAEIIGEIEAGRAAKADGLI